MLMPETDLYIVARTQCSRDESRKQVLDTLYQLKMYCDLHSGKKLRWSFFLALTDLAYRKIVLHKLSCVENNEISELAKTLGEMTDIQISLMEGSKTLGKDVYVKEYNNA